MHIPQTISRVLENCRAAIKAVVLPPTERSRLRPHQRIPSNHVRREVVWFLSGLAVIVGVIVAYGPLQFGGADGGALANAAWMCHRGYKPYVDFLSPSPPVFLVGGTLAYTIFGVKWLSLIYFAAVFSAFSYAIQWLSLRRLPMAWGWKVLICFSTQALTQMPLGWGYYNQPTASTGALFLTSAMVLLYGVARRLEWACLLIALTLLFLMKPNVAGLLIISLLPLLASVRWNWGRVLGGVLVAAAVANVILAVFRINPFDVLRGYLATTDRLSNGGTFFRFIWLNNHQEVIATLVASAPLVIVFVMIIKNSIGHRDWLGLHWREVALACVGFVTSIVAMGTNNEHNMVDLPVFVSGLILLTTCSARTLLTRKQMRIAETVLALGCGAILANAFVCTTERKRVESVGWGSFYEPSDWTPITQLENPTYLRGLYAGPRMHGAVQQCHELLQLYRCLDRPDAPVFFGIRMDWAYPAFGIDKPKGLFLWWAGTGEASAAAIEEDVRRFINCNFKLCIFLQKDYTYAPQRLVEYLYSEFNVFDTGLLTVHVAKDWQPLNEALEAAGRRTQLPPSN